MNFHPQDRMALLVDGNGLWHTAKALGFDIDFAKLHDWLAERAGLSRALYFTPMDDTGEFTPVRRLADWMEFNGWQVITKPHGDLSVDLAVAMLEMAPHIHHFVLASGNGDYVPAVDAVQRRGRRVTILSTIKTRPAICSEDLRRAGDAFIDLADLKDAIHRPARAAKEAVSA